MTSLFEVGPVGALDRITCDLLVLASGADQRDWYPVFKRRRTMMEKILESRATEGNEIPLISVVSALAIWGGPERRENLVAADPIISLIRTLTRSNVLVSEPFTTLPSPEELVHHRGDPETVRRSYTHIVEFLTSTEWPHGSARISAGRTLAAGGILIRRIVESPPAPQSDMGHQISKCPQCLHLMAELGCSTGDLPDTGSLRKSLHWITTVLIAAYTGVNPDVVAHMLEVGPT